MAEADDLDRFGARDDDGVLDAAMGESRAGREDHPLTWFVFPQIAGLGSSPTAQRDASASSAEAPASDAETPLGGIHPAKSRYSMPRFARAPPEGPAFAACSTAGTGARRTRPPSLPLTDRAGTLPATTGGDAMRRWIALALGALALLVVVAVVAVVAVAGRPAQPGAAAAPVPPPVAWKPCTDAPLAGSDAQCGTVTVPLDHARPDDGRTVRIAVSRVRHTATPYAGVVLVNPGGPGASGLGLAAQGASVPRGVGARYDWIGFDPRGVGASRPRLTCDADYADGARPPYSPATAASIRAWRQRSEAYARECGRAGDLLDHMTTRDAAEDLETLRQALRVDAISYYGYSYGTYLGQVYATLHPGRVRRMVLDSTVDPSRVWYGANLDQDAAFDVAITAWFDWLADHDDAYGLGTTRRQVESAYRRTAARLAAEPAGGRFGSAEWADTILYAGYSQSLWPQLGAAFAAASEGRTEQAQEDWTSLNDVRDDNGYAVYLAVECTDTSWPADWSTWERDTRRVDATAPFSTWLNTWFNAPCRTWPGKSSTPVRVDGSKAPPILMIDETLDAATPYSGSVAVRRLFPEARLLAEPGGTTHADSLSGNACVDGAVADYLADGTLPTRHDGDGPDATCAPLPVPSP